MNKKYIFLDFDGVLITKKHNDQLSSQGLPLTDEKGFPFFDPEAVECLRKIIEATGAEIIISSSRKLDGTELILKIWEERQMPGKITDFTSTSPFQLMRIEYVYNDDDDFKMDDDDDDYFNKYTSRCHIIEIDEWIMRNGNCSDKYLILEGFFIFTEYEETEITMEEDEVNISETLHAYKQAFPQIKLEGHELRSYDEVREIYKRRERIMFAPDERKGLMTQNVEGCIGILNTDIFQS